MLVTKGLVPGESMYGEKRISVNGGVEDAAGVLGGLDDTSLVQRCCTLVLRLGRVCIKGLISLDVYVLLFALFL